MQYRKFVRKSFLAALAALACVTWSGALSALEDGLYTFRGAPNQYVVLLSNGDLYQGFVFSANLEDTEWDQIRGSRIDDATVRVSDIGRREGRIKFFEVKQGVNGFEALRTSCIDYPDDSGECAGSSIGPFNYDMLMAANGQLKAIFETQWGARIAMFESDGVVVSLVFEFGNNLTDNTIVSAYTGVIDSGLLISEIVEVVAPSNDDGEVEFEMTWQISDLGNPQMEIKLSDCSRGGQTIDCSALDPFFSQVVRVF